MGNHEEVVVEVEALEVLAVVSASCYFDIISGKGTIQRDL